ncbi:MAG TPA: SIS domain-containing protein [Gaiellaceae bacterium]|jgi:D-sedoheptulose 7-phosphate isomerase|nr:SIS domain-containing protein [Gaiellaceae bacterium]
MADARQSIADHVAVAGAIEGLLPQVEQIVAALIECYRDGGRVYTFGNGGSAADSMHFAEELVARFKRERRPLAAQSFAADPTALTCIANDYAFDEVFARQVRAFARQGDVVIGFTTSGRSPNVVRGLAAAREAGARTVLFGGGEGTPAAGHADHALVVPSESTARVQEMHVLLLHLVLDAVDEWAHDVGSAESSEIQS